PTASQRLTQLRATVDTEPQAAGGERVGERGGQLREQLSGGVLRRADHERLLRLDIEVAQRLVMQSQDAPGLAQQLLTVRSEPRAAALPFDQRTTDRRL